jgi:hypothetical protein
MTTTTTVTPEDDTKNDAFLSFLRFEEKAKKTFGARFFFQRE